MREVTVPSRTDAAHQTRRRSDSPQGRIATRFYVRLVGSTAVALREPESGDPRSRLASSP